MAASPDVEDAQDAPAAEIVIEKIEAVSGARTARASERVTSTWNIIWNGETEASEANNNFKTNQEILDDFHCMDLPLFSILKDLAVLASMRRKTQQKRHGQHGLAHPMVPLHPRRARPPQRPWHPPGS